MKCLLWALIAGWLGISTAYAGQAKPTENNVNIAIYSCSLGQTTNSGFDVGLNSLKKRILSGGIQFSRSEIPSVIGTGVQADEAKIVLFDHIQKCVIEHVYGTQSPRIRDEVLPGFAADFPFQVHDITELRRKYFFAFRTPEGAKTSLYLSSDNRFKFAVTNIYGDTETLDIPLGQRDGIPFEKFTVLFCEVGVASNYSYLRALVNGKEIARRDLDTTMDLGSRDWKPFPIGADEHGENPGALTWAGIGALNRTLSDLEIAKLMESERRHYGD